jgi:hypothetical protein
MDQLMAYGVKPEAGVMWPRPQDGDGWSCLKDGANLVLISYPGKPRYITPIFPALISILFVH